LRTAIQLLLAYLQLFSAVSEPWCGLLSACPVHEGTSVTIGCYARYEWLAALLQYNPRVSIASSIEFLHADGTTVKTVPELLRPPGPPPPVLMMTSYTIENVTAGQILNYTCQIQYIFTGRGYSLRNDYANNTLTWDRCSVTETVACKYKCSTLSCQILRRSARYVFCVKITCCVSLVPFLTHCTRLMSNSKNLLTCFLKYNFTFSPSTYSCKRKQQFLVSGGFGHCGWP